MSATNDLVLLLENGCVCLAVDLNLLKIGSVGNDWLPLSLYNGLGNWNITRYVAK